MKTFPLLLALLSFQWLSVMAGEGNPVSLTDALKDIDGVRISELPKARGFSESLLLWVKQPLNHVDTSKGWFWQRVFIQHKDAEGPVVMVTEGYSADYANNAFHMEELTRWLNASQWVVEHRYFGLSKPESPQWKYLTVENAAHDHHRIVQIIKKLYTGRLITTGISKGGQTATYHRAFFPDDADATVAYVAPINIAQEDPREIYFLKTVGPDSTREAILTFQREVLKKRAEILPILEYDVKLSKSTLAMSADSTLDYLVLEYPFSFWQWGLKHSDIPLPGADAEALYKHLSDVIGPEMYSHPGMDYFYPFSYQAYTEIGYYGYDTTGLGRWLSIPSGYISNIVMVPEGPEYVFNPSTLQKVRDFISLKGNHILYIYGEYDPWTASAAMPTTAVSSRRFVEKMGNHRARIHTLSKEQKEEIRQLLSDWMKLSLKPI